MAIRSLPQIFMFTDKMVLCFGSDIKPKLFDGTTVTDITNTFTAQYPTWQASSQYAVGDLAQPSPTNTHFYKSVQAGKSGAAQPAFPTTTGARVVDNQVIWQEAGLVTANPAPPGAAHGIVHFGSLWVFNTSSTNTADGLDGPSSLRMSDLNNPTSWNTLNQSFIDKDDGTQGMGLTSFTIAETGIAPQGSLVVFKEFSTFQITGVFGATNFSIQRVQTDMGCVAPRSIQFVPGFGVIRLSHLGVTLFDGVRDRIISEEIRPYIFGGRPDITGLDWNFAYFSKGSQVAVPPMYLLGIPLVGDNGQIKRILKYDLVLRSWSVSDLTFPISSMLQARSSGAFPTTLFGGWNDGTMQRWQSGDLRWRSWQSFAGDVATLHLGTPITWSFRTPPIHVSGPGQRFYIRRLVIRGSSTNATSGPTRMQVDIFTEGKLRRTYLLKTTGVADIRLLRLGANEFEAIVDVNLNAIDAYAVISGTETNVEIETIDWHLQPKPVGVPVLVS